MIETFKILKEMYDVNLSEGLFRQQAAGNEKRISHKKSRRLKTYILQLSTEHLEQPSRSFD